MPYSVKKRKCKNKKGKKGKYVVTKKGKNKKISCHTSKEKAQGAVGARYANESYLFIAEKIFEALLGENTKKEKKYAGSHPDESYQYGWPEFDEKEFDNDGKTTYGEDRKWTEQYLKSMGMLK
mgnify:FL=1|tara:strand:- start:266 stop:634 length:369 start_codon:yes stop_codon:yes gene_type:complete